MSKELQNIEIFKEIQAEKFYQQKLTVANGVIEMGKILCETKEKLKHGEWINWIKDSRINISRITATKYMKIYHVLVNVSDHKIFGDLSFNNLYELCRLSQEVREEMIENSETSKDLIKQLKCYKKQRKNPSKQQIMSISVRSGCNCECCNQSFKEMENILQLHHVDGNRNNTIEENLIHLCPTCHSVIHNCDKVEIIENEKLKELWLKVRGV